MNWFSKIHELAGQEYERYLPTAFDESLTLLEKVNKVIETLNQIVLGVNTVADYVDGHVDTQNEKIKQLRDDFEILKDWLENEGLEERTTQVLNEWFDNGRLAQIINNDVFDMKADKATFEQFVDSITHQLTQTEQDLTAQLQHNRSDLNARALNVKNPPLPFSPAKGDGSTSDTSVVKALIAYLKGSTETVYLYFPFGTYNFDTKIGQIDFPLFLIGQYSTETGTGVLNKRGTILFDNSPSVGDDGTPFIKFSRDDESVPTTYGGYLQSGIQIMNITIRGNGQSHDGLHLRKLPWGTNFHNVTITNFKGSGLYINQCFDSVYHNLQITDCGGAYIDGAVRYSLEMTATSGDNTNAQHFYGTHIENTRYALKLDVVLGVTFDSIKFELEESGYANDVTNPWILLTENAKAVSFDSVYLVAPSVELLKTGGKTYAQMPYIWEKRAGSQNDWVAGKMSINNMHTITHGWRGAKWFNLNGAVLSNVLLNHSTGAGYSSRFRNCLLTNVDVTTVSEIDGANYGIDIDSYTQANNIKVSTRKYLGSDATTNPEHPGIYIHGYDTVLDNYKVNGFGKKVLTETPHRKEGAQIKRNRLTYVLSTVSSTIDMSVCDSSVIVLNPSADVTITNFSNVSCGEIITLYNNTTHVITINSSGNIRFNNTIATGQSKTFVVSDPNLLPII